MRTEEEVLAQFDEWAQGNDLIRAAVLTSSRVAPERATDFLSDYDIELYVADIGPFQIDDEWLSAFGPIFEIPREALTLATRWTLATDSARCAPQVDGYLQRSAQQEGENHWNTLH